MAIRVLYAIFLGLLVVVFVGWAMAAYYPTPRWTAAYPEWGPESPQAPMEPSPYELQVLSEAERKARLERYAAELQEYRARLSQYEAQKKEYEALRAEFQERVQTHHRTVAMISLVIAVAIMVVSVVFSSRLGVISDGLLLGGLFTLLYSIGWSFVSGPRVAVLVVGVALAVAIWIGYLKFQPTGMRRRAPG